jgi:hypothetical protein
MSIAAENLPLPRRYHDAMESKYQVPRRCRDGIQKNVLIFKAVTDLN